MIPRSAPLHAVCTIACAIMLAGACAAQAQQLTADSYREVLRADVRAKRTAVVAETMRLTERDAAVFWPIYRDYERDLARVHDERLEVLNYYAEKFTSLSDADAKTVSEKLLDCDARKAELDKKYFKRFSKVLPAITVAKFFQVEHMLDLLVELKLVSSVPALTDRPETTTAQK